jgi:hypothetical protein
MPVKFDKKQTPHSSNNRSVVDGCNAIRKIHTNITVLLSAAGSNKVIFHLDFE